MSERTSSVSSVPPARSVTPTRTSFSTEVISPPRRFSSPVSNRFSTYSDRFIPSRMSSQLDDALDGNDSLDTSKATTNNSDITHENQGILNNLIRAELLGKSPLNSSNDYDQKSYLANLSSSSSLIPGTSHVLKFRTPKKRASTGSMNLSRDSIQPQFSVPSVLQAQAVSTNKAVRKISRLPYKVLDAPNLADDYYLNLVDWSASNVVAVALGSSVFLWSASTSKVTKLCDLDDAVTSITWAVRALNRRINFPVATGSQIAVGSFSGQVQIWDAAQSTFLREMKSHTSRVGTLAWSSSMLASGSRDRTILVQDVRVRGHLGTPSSSHSHSRSPHNSFIQQSPFATPRSSLHGSFVTGTADRSRLSTPLSRLVVPTTSQVTGSATDYIPPPTGSRSDSDQFISGYADIFGEGIGVPVDAADNSATYSFAESTSPTGGYTVPSSISSSRRYGTASQSFSNTPTRRPPSSRGTSLEIGMSTFRDATSTSPPRRPPSSRGTPPESGVSPVRDATSLSPHRLSDIDSRVPDRFSAGIASAFTLFESALPPPSPDRLGVGNGRRNGILVSPPPVRHSLTSLDDPMIASNLIPLRSSTNGGLSSLSPFSIGAHAPVNSSTSEHGLGTGDPCVIQELTGHKQEVCGLKWSFDERMLASGGNDNKLYVWQPQTGRRAESEPLCKFSDHTAAVKAVCWSPHQHGLLASGGGTADRHIRFWNATTGLPLHRIDTGSQVCNLVWSSTVNEIVSTHGYSLNQVIVWKYPSMQKQATLTGHTMRVLYLAMSPDGQSVVTGAGDETLRFWNVFPGPRSSLGMIPGGQSSLFPSNRDIR